jgi:GNAT superfamily N-acetyltransferase
VIEVRALTGEEITPWLAPLAQLRIAVFRDWPYLYEGDADYEARYLARYARSPDAVVVLALDGDRAVGASTGMPLEHEDAVFREPFAARGIAPASVFYFGESVLLPEYRRRGIGHRFFDAREDHARRLAGVSMTAFCAVERDPDDPHRPPGAHSNDAFWSSRGYERQEDLICTLDWPEVGETAARPHRLHFWLRLLEPHGR